MEFVINILQTVVGIVIAYFVVRRLTKSKDQFFTNKFFKYLGVLFMLVIALTAITMYITAAPELVEQAVKQLKEKGEIQNLIGAHNGYGYNSNKIEQISKYPASVELSLSGSDAEVNLLVLIDSTSTGYKVRNYQILKVTEK